MIWAWTVRMPFSNNWSSNSNFILSPIRAMSSVGEVRLKFFGNGNWVGVDYVTWHPPAWPPWGYPALSHSNINELETALIPSPLCSVITLLNIVLLSADIIGFLFGSTGFIWIWLGSCRHMWRPLENCLIVVLLTIVILSLYTFTFLLEFTYIRIVYI